MAVDLPRETALKILYEINREDAYSNISLNRNIEELGDKLKPVDRAFITEIVYGTLKWMLKIDWIIASFSSIKLNRISPWILNILRMGVFQVLFMDRVPVSAACNESVRLAKKYGHKGSAGFVNAVLRRIASSKDNLGPVLPDKSDLLKYLSVNYSHPEWMVEKFLKSFGPEFTESLLDANNQEPPLTIRINTIKTGKENLVLELKKENISVSPGLYCDDALVLENPSSLSKIRAFNDGFFTVQDESSMLAVRALDPRPGEFVRESQLMQPSL